MITSSTNCAFIATVTRCTPKMRTMDCSVASSLAKKCREPLNCFLGRRWERKAISRRVKKGVLTPLEHWYRRNSHRPVVRVVSSNLEGAKRDHRTHPYKDV